MRFKKQILLFIYEEENFLSPPLDAYSKRKISKYVFGMSIKLPKLLPEKKNKIIFIQRSERSYEAHIVKKKSIFFPSRFKRFNK